jgi:hypothetical protein
MKDGGLCGRILKRVLDDVNQLRSISTVCGSVGDGATGFNAGVNVGAKTKELKNKEVTGKPCEPATLNLILAQVTK